MKKIDTERFEERLIEKGYTEFKPSSDVCHWLVKWAEYKLWELDKDDDY